MGHCPAPLNAVEVAVVLETCGYTAGRARALGTDGLIDLAERVFDLMPLYSSAMSRRGDGGGGLRSRPPGPLDLGRGLAYSSPWLVSLATMLIAGVSFWSSNVALPSIANAVTLATAVSLLVTGPFIQAFGRRASFYIGLGDQGMVVRITRWTLELGLVATGLCALALYLVRNDVLRRRHAGHGPPWARRRHRHRRLAARSGGVLRATRLPLHRRHRRGRGGGAVVVRHPLRDLCRPDRVDRVADPVGGDHGGGVLDGERMVAPAGQARRRPRCGARRARHCSAPWPPTASTVWASSPSWSSPSS